MSDEFEDDCQKDKLELKFSNFDLRDIIEQQELSYFLVQPPIFEMMRMHRNGSFYDQKIIEKVKLIIPTKNLSRLNDIDRDKIKRKIDNQIVKIPL